MMDIAVLVTPAGSSTELLNPNAFQNFRVTIDVQGATPYQVDHTLSRLGRKDGDHLWVQRQSLIELAGPLGTDPGWLASVAAMCEAVRRFGWIDDDGRIRAHIVA